MRMLALVGLLVTIITSAGCNYATTDYVDAVDKKNRQFIHDRTMDLLNTDAAMDAKWNTRFHGLHEKIKSGLMTCPLVDKKPTPENHCYGSKFSRDPFHVLAQEGREKELIQKTFQKNFGIRWPVHLMTTFPKSDRPARKLQLYFVEIKTGSEFPDDFQCRAYRYYQHKDTSYIKPGH